MHASSLLRVDKLTYGMLSRLYDHVCLILSSHNHNFLLEFWRKTANDLITSYFSLHKGLESTYIIWPYVLRCSPPNHAPLECKWLTHDSMVRRVRVWLPYIYNKVMKILIVGSSFIMMSSYIILPLFFSSKSSVVITINEEVINLTHMITY